MVNLDQFRITTRTILSKEYVSDRASWSLSRKTKTNEA